MLIAKAANTNSRELSRPIINHRAEKIRGLFEKQKPDRTWSFEGYTPSQTGKWSHSYHRYPAKFIPQLVENLIDKYVTTNTAHINDPFMGSGTTIVTAISRGFKASGTDVNGIAFLMTKVKATPIEPDLLEEKIKCFLSDLSPHSTTKPFIPKAHLERIDYWFDGRNKFELGKILATIQKEKNDACREFLLVAFSHILKNCSIWLQKSNKPTRDLQKIPEDPYQALQRHLKKMQRGNKQFYEIVPAKTREYLQDYLNIQLGDARKQPADKESVDLVVTSSPYVTSYEYADLHQLSTIWLEFSDDLKQYRKEFIGTSYKAYEEIILDGEIALSIVDEMKEHSPKMAKEIEAFFLDMQEVFTDSYRILKKGGRCCYVIGNTALRGVNIYNGEAFAEGLELAGFRLDDVITREIPSKILPQTRDEKTGRFASSKKANALAYPHEYIIVGYKR
jgi:DNA modification methylase